MIERLSNLSRLKNIKIGITDPVAQEYGYVHEYGSIIKNIPERSFIRSTLSSIEYRNMVNNLVSNYLTGKISLSDFHDNYVSETVKMIQDKITDLDLVDTGRLRNSIGEII